MLSHMPHYRHEVHGFIKQLRDYLTRPAEPGDVLQQVGNATLSQPHLVVGDPLAPGATANGELALTLFWLEHLARLGFLARHEPWGTIFDRVLSDRDRLGVWRPAKGKLPAAAAAPEAWGTYPLDPRRESDAVAAEVTMRLGLVARAAGREVVLA
jgi:hypothetical protein